MVMCRSPLVAAVMLREEAVRWRYRARAFGSGVGRVGRTGRKPDFHVDVGCVTDAACLLTVV